MSEVRWRSCPQTMYSTNVILIAQLNTFARAIKQYTAFVCKSIFYDFINPFKNVMTGQQQKTVVKTINDLQYWCPSIANSLTSTVQWSVDSARQDRAAVLVASARGRSETACVRPCRWAVAASSSNCCYRTSRLLSTSLPTKCSRKKT